MTITTELFGRTRDGHEVQRYTLENEGGMRVQLLSYGCVVQSIVVPDRDGRPTDVVLGYDTLEEYEQGTAFFGAFVGRYANRIANSEFVLNGKKYTLKENEGRNHLHGTFSREVFDGRIEGDSVVFDKCSLPEEEGFPGTLSLTVRYTLTEANALVIDYRATTDADTVLNFTNHSYFNLNGDGGDVLGHVLWLDADGFTEIDRELLPTGRIFEVAETPFDFRVPKEIGRDIGWRDPQLAYGQGYDHNFVLNGAGKAMEAPESPRVFARAWGEKSGICLTASTTQPGVQLYSGNFVGEEGAPAGKGGVRYPRHGGFCLETQHFPDSVNIPEFPSAVLKKEEIYAQTTVYQFSCE